MANLSEDIQCASFDTRPPMLDMTDFASWQQCIRLYCQGKENGVNILKSIDEGPFQMRTVREPLVEGTKGAPRLGHMGQCEDAPRRHKGETIHDYYVRFAKLINDMRNIKMAMSRMQLNSKFVNNMLPEWGRFVIAVKLNRGLRDSNYDQLYAYLKQREIHANENKMMLDRFSQHTWDPLALMSNVSYQQHYLQSSSTLLFTYGRQNRGQGTNPRGGGAAGYGGVQNRVGNANPGQARQDLALNVDNTFQANDYDAFDSDVDKAPTTQTMFMTNLPYADPDDEAV
nr:hypothetical protein [Tanacetum cinerariifolium]